ncbi:tRNA uridine-5-carboxymethylaminomethyl(34) synthesis enzyme MnmG [Candidatus Vidania fulgoroideorum]
MKKYEIIIVGGGHAGIEAAYFLSKKKIKFLLITECIDNIGKMSCNPSVGGIGKSQIVKEIDSIGGLMGFISDISGLSFKTINTSKGLAVQSTRIQTDKYLYSFYCKKFLKKINILQDIVKELLINKDKIIGIKLENGLKIYCNIVILTTGTFLNSKIYTGNKCYKIDSEGKKSRSSISKQLNYYIGIKRFKTGTPPRFMKESINYKNLKKNYSDIPTPYFSLRKNKVKYKKYYNNKKFVNCYSTKTNSYTNSFILENIKLSSMYSGMIRSRGPRFCPSLEDKIYKFDKKLVNIFLERESIYTNYIYPTGLSNSLPKNIQKKIIRTINGLERVKILNYGYAIEYDYFDSKLLNKSLESKLIEGLFMAGQINGTTGYEEAAGQGIIAGINSYRKIKNIKPLIFKRTNSYIGIMIDDLTKKNIIEPYRMFTSRSENRLYNREDNSIIRLYKHSKNLYNKKESCIINNFLVKINKIIFFFKKKKLFLKKNKSLFNSIRDKNINSFFLKKIGIKTVYIRVLLGIIIYRQYIKSENKKNLITKNNIKKDILLKNINLKKIGSISKEVLYNIKVNKPKTIRDLCKITGINLSNIFEIIKLFNENKSL